MKVTGHICVALVCAGLLGFAGCENTQVVRVGFLTIEPEETGEGARLVVVTQSSLAYREVIEDCPNVKSVTRVTNNSDFYAQYGPPELSPTEDALVCSLFFKEGLAVYSNIWKTAVGASANTRVTSGNWLDMFPAFTPDGKSLLFSSDRTGRYSILRVSLEGGAGITRITSGLAQDYAPSVFPDGRLIAYTSLVPGSTEPQVWTVPVDGNLPTQLRGGSAPQVSPDGKKLLFTRLDKKNSKWRIWVMSVDGNHETQLTQGDTYNAIQPRWSPDGKWIVYASDEGLDSRGKQHNYDIWLIAADGTRKTQLTTNGSRDDSPCWDRTGKSIYFRSNRGGMWNIWRFEPIIGEAQAIPRPPAKGEAKQS